MIVELSKTSYDLRSPTYGEKTDVDILAYNRGETNQYIFLKEITYRICCKNKPENKSDYINELIKVKKEIDELSLQDGKKLRDSIIKFLNSESDVEKK